MLNKKKTKTTRFIYISTIITAKRRKEQEKKAKAKKNGYRSF